jgi:hypothetical protein
MAVQISGTTVIDNNRYVLGIGLTVSGISTFSGAISVGSSTGTSGQILQSTGTGVTWAQGVADIDITSSLFV